MDAQHSGINLARQRPFPERAPPRLSGLDAAAVKIFGAIRRSLKQTQRTFQPAGEGIVAAVSSRAPEWAALSDAEVAARGRGLRSALRRDGFRMDLVATCFAAIGEAARRTLGQRYYPAQLVAGWAMLGGNLVEMATGEGKTFAATLPACVAAIAGYPVHIVTVNDYLARRDAETMQALYGFFGIRVSFIHSAMDRRTRQAAYSAGITYCTNSNSLHVGTESKCTCMV